MITKQEIFNYFWSKKPFREDKTLEEEQEDKQMLKLIKEYYRNI